SGRAHLCVPMAGGCRTHGGIDWPLFDERVPGATIRAAAGPLRGLGSTLLADEDGFGGFHRNRIVSGIGRTAAHVAFISMSIGVMIGWAIVYGELYLLTPYGYPRGM